ncbi:MAG: MFS transporter [Gammaproteobacteria bacterium]|nr:MFS transporter [Gammaproteobacteria bacterium]NNE05436.1 MFS transporter [Xanthomonadales bacterium]
MTRVPKVTPNGMPARVMLAFLATAGLFYVNIMPALVNGLIDGLGFSNQQAGAIGSANVYGAAFGALCIVFFIKKLNWKIAATVMLIGLIGMDLLSMLVQDAAWLTATRFVHGFVGGMLVGTGFSVIARTSETDRTFGVLLFVQFGLGGLGVMLLPGLVPVYGVTILFWSLIAFSAVTLAMLPFLPAYPAQDQANPLSIEQSPVARVPLVLTLLAIFAFQGANMGLYAFIIGLGKHYGLELGFISTTLGIAAWIGLAGAGLVILMSDRFGHFRPIVWGTLLTAAGSAAFVFSDIAAVFFIANCLLGVTWAFVIAYLLGLVSRFDSRGQMAALGGFASKMGLASGPALVAWLLGEDNYALVIWVCVSAMVASILLVWRPASLQDRAAQAQVVFRSTRP